MVVMDCLIPLYTDLKAGVVSVDWLQCMYIGLVCVAPAVDSLISLHTVILKEGG